MRTAKAHRRAVRLLAALSALALAALAFAALASADYEQVGNFGNENEEAEQLGGYSTGGAVNITGAGGVESGSVYFSVGDSGNRILRYSPKGEFKEAWGWGLTKNRSLLNEQFERCGPALGTECLRDGVHGDGGGASRTSEESTTNCGTATDSAGDLYVVDREGSGRVYGPGGAQLTEFKFNSAHREICNIAVDSSGAIYAVARRTGFNALGEGNPSEVLKLEPVGGAYPPTSATKYAKGSTIYGAGILEGGIVAMATEHGIASVAINPANQHIYATEAAGNEIQVFKKPTEAFKLKCEGSETATLKADSSQVEIGEALEAVGCGTVRVSGEIVFGHWGVVFEGSLAETHVGKLETIKAGGNEQATELAIGSSSPHISIYGSNGTRLETIVPSISGASYYGIGIYGTNGDVYVADKAHNKAYVLSSSGSLKTEITGSSCEKGAFAAMEAPTLAVDQSNGNVLVSDVSGHGVVDEFDSSGNCLLSIDRPFAEAGPSAIAIDNSGGANNHVAYVASKDGATASVYAYAPPTGSSRAELPALSHEEPGSFNEPRGVAVDQQTGYVYVVNTTHQNDAYIRLHDLVEVFSADGSERIAHFGDAPSASDTLEGSPEKLSEPASIAVGKDGTVYVGSNGKGEYPSRAMCFRPQSPGDYKHYVYCGRAQDIEVAEPRYLASDDAGHLYAGNAELLTEFAPGEPAALLCTFNTHGQAWSMTTDPQTGEVFYFTFGDKSMHRLKPCDPAKGSRFEEAQAKVKVSPPTGPIGGLAFNPTLSWGPGRPQGVLYGIDNEPHEIGGVTHFGLGYVLAQAGGLSPAVLSESFSDTRTASAVLHAEIDPNGFATHYVFQYLTTAQYEANPSGERFAGAAQAPAGGGQIGSGSVGSAAAAITGLAPDTAYRFRVIATSECNGKGGEPCTNEGKALGFTTYPLFPPGLPDHRAYELVSPAQKHGGEVIPAEPQLGSCLSPNGSIECKPIPNNAPFPMQSSPDGEALAYMGRPFNPFEGAVTYDSYVSRRTAAGWQTTALIPALPPEGVNQVGFDSTLEQGLLSVEATQSERASLEIHPTAEPGARTPLVAGDPPNRSAGNSNAFKLSYGGHSADFSRIFFAANDTLTEATPFAPEPPDPGASKSDLYEWHEGQLTVVNVAPGNATVMAGASYASISPDTHAVSEDGARVYFEDEAGNLYVREQGEVTRQIDDPGHFLSATPDGSEVLLDNGCLYSIESESCTDLTEGQGGFKGMLGQSKDLSQIYFADGKALATGAEAGTCTQASGGSQQDKEELEGKVPAGLGCNVYFYEAGAPLRFIAALPAFHGITQRGTLNDWVQNPAERTAEASPNGRFLVFASLVSLTGYNNFARCGLKLSPKNNGDFEPSSGPCSEAFLYDSATGELSCASCNPTGEAPLGNTTLRRIHNAPESLPQPRYLTDEGRLYFDTQDSLSARDTNEGVEDVYEFAPQGAGAQGTCNREAGCAFLISAGTEAVDSNLIAVDETGKNVFFDTRDKLALKDKDELLDVYDAREGGGIAAETEIARAECQGENCQAPVSPPNDPTPSSSTFEGAGNVKEASVAKKHAKKKHAKKHKKAKKQARTAKRNRGGAK